jgi:hypothetical protein
MDPVANGTHCTICKEPFQIQLSPRFETVPDLQGVDAFILNHYLFCCLTVQGAFLFFSMGSSQPFHSVVSQSILATNIALQPAFFLVAARNWRVHNLVLYLRLHCRTFFVPSPLSFLSALLYYVYSGHTSVGLLLYVLLAQYWSEHTATLRAVNNVLVQI